MRKLTPVSIVLAFALCACSHTSNVFRVQGPRALLFPPGTYFHEVTISLEIGKQQGVQGIVKTEPMQNRIVGLGPFQATLFNLAETLPDHRVKLEIFEPRMEKLRDRILSFYRALAPLLHYRLKNTEDRPASLNSRGYDVTLSDYDENSLPRNIRLANDKFTVDIRVTRYEVGNETK